MQIKNQKPPLKTNDKIIRSLLVSELETLREEGHNFRIIEELGINHGQSRVDVAVVNGVMHGFEIKSDLDTLLRLPEQVKAYNGVFNKVTIVVGYSHLFDVMHLVPDWWGIKLARFSSTDSLLLHMIREPEQNPSLDNISIARLLWKEEAINILEELDAVKGVKSKTRGVVYERLVGSLSQDQLQKKVRETLCLRVGWRADQQLLPSGG